jgi:hypothetical protein
VSNRAHQVCDYFVSYNGPRRPKGGDVPATEFFRPGLLVDLTEFDHVVNNLITFVHITHWKESKGFVLA